MKVVESLLTLVDMEINADIRLPPHVLRTLPLTLLLRSKKQDVVERALAYHHTFIKKWFVMENPLLMVGASKASRINKRRRTIESTESINTSNNQMAGTEWQKNS